MTKVVKYIIKKQTNGTTYHKITITKNQYRDKKQFTNDIDPDSLQKQFTNDIDPDSLQKQYTNDIDDKSTDIEYDFENFLLDILSLAIILIFYNIIMN